MKVALKRATLQFSFLIPLFLFLFLLLTNNWKLTFLELAAIVVTLIVLKDPYWGLCLMFFLMPLEEATQIIPNWTAVKGLGYLVLGAYLLNLFIKKKSIYIIKPFHILFAYVLLRGMSSLWAFYKGAFQIYAMLNLLMQVAFIFLIAQLITTVDKLKFIVFSYLLGAAAASMWGLYNLFSHPTLYRLSLVISPEAQRGMFAPIYASVLSLGLLFSLSLLLASKRKIMKFFYLIVGILLFAPLLSSGLRGGIASLGFSALITIIYLSLRERKPDKIIYLFILGVLGYLSYTLAPMPVKQRYEKETVFTGFKDRMECWKIGVVEILEAPILGVGLSNSGLLADSIRAIALSKYGINISARLATDWVPYEYYYPLGIRDIHNIYLEVCAESGLITLAIFIWFIVSIAKMLFKSLRMVPMYSELWQMGLGLLASFVFVLFIGMSEPVLNRKIFWSIFGLIIAFYRIVTENKQNKYKEEQL